MKYLLFVFIPTIALLSTISFMKKPKRIVFFGDSITEVGVKPNGYISQLQDSLSTADVELIGAGVSGNKVYDLYLRLEEDVLARQPDQVFIFVGVNDVWHKRLLGTGTDADKFRRFYTALIRKMQAANIKLVLCTPACIGEKTDYTNPLDGELNLYAQIIRDLAAEYQLGLCDLRKEFQVYNLEHNLKNLEKGVLTTDGVHLNVQGNTLVAQLMLEHIKG